MTASLYIQAYQEMLLKHKEEFAAFAKADVNDKARFDELGKPLLRIISDEENKLCLKTEHSGRSQYATQLAEKFRAEIRKNFPLIDLVGVTISG